MSPAYILVASLAVALVIYVFLVEPYAVRLKKIELAIPDLPDHLRGFIICHLSDTHSAGYGRLERRIHRLLTGLEADLCVMTGDLISSPEGLDTIQRVLSGFEPKHGVYAVVGNGDYKTGLAVEEIERGLRQSKVGLLLNEHLTLRLNGGLIHVIGVDDPFRGRDKVAEAMSGMSEEGFRLMLAHAPDVLVKTKDKRIDLILAGHTHGGQVRLPFIGPIWLHSRCGLPISDGYYDGAALIREIGEIAGDTRIFVSRGLGWSGISARFLCRPEVVLITLRAQV